MDWLADNVIGTIPKSRELKEQAKPDEFFDHPKDPRLKEFLSKIL